MSYIERLRSALRKTIDWLNRDVRDLFQKGGRLVDDEFLTELYAILIRTDMGVATAQKIRDRIGYEYRARVLDLVETKAAGKKPKVVAFRPKKQKEDQLAGALEASLAGLKRGAKPRRKAHG